ncbi:hypothetical protein GCM10020221_35560 [Streptomyces thioluteus]|uniref:Uncharacterized protein n=1 Tax=Streptomyces thioluteus TaxID=66431 RepID=A0ABP6JMJ4_STRTU
MTEVGRTVGGGGTRGEARLSDADGAELLGELVVLLVRGQIRTLPLRLLRAHKEVWLPKANEKG